MTLIRIMLIGLAVSSILSCNCLKSVSVKPEMNAVDIEKANIGVIKGDIEFVFKECCPSREEEAIALSIKQKAVVIFDDLLSNKITVEEYNTKIAAIHGGLKKVVYACNKEDTESKGLETGSLESAWEELKSLNEKL